MEMLVLIGLGFFLWAESQEKSRGTRKPAAATRPQGSRSIVSGNRISKSSVGFADLAQKEKAFSTFIGWARREAKRQGRCFDSIRGNNDYQRARTVFHHSGEWKKLRARVLARYNKCLCCGSHNHLTVDHVVPVVTRPDKFNQESNLQTLCWSCNAWKHIQAIDFRGSAGIGGKGPGARPTN